MSVARTMASGRRCVGRQVAAVATVARRIAATGTEGTARGVRHGNDGDGARSHSFAVAGTEPTDRPGSQGEENASMQSGHRGGAMRGSTPCSTLSPSLQRTETITDASIAKVVDNAEYPLRGTALDLLRETGLARRRVRPST